MAKKQVEYSVGDKVAWSSQASGNWTEKAGVIVVVLQAGQFPSGEYRNKNIGTTTRRETSYIVAVWVGSKHSPDKRQLYWPVARNLRRVKKATLGDKLHPSPVKVSENRTPENGSLLDEMIEKLEAKLVAEPAAEMVQDSIDVASDDDATSDAGDLPTHMLDDSSGDACPADAGSHN